MSGNRVREPKLVPACVVPLLAFLLLVGIVTDVRAQADSLIVVPTAPTLPSPTGAMVRSLVVPGWGQYYNGKQMKAGTHLLLQVGLLAGVIMERDSGQAGGLTPLGNSLLLGLVGVKLFSVADAYVDAHFADYELAATGLRDRTIYAGVAFSW